MVMTWMKCDMSGMLSDMSGMLSDTAAEWDTHINETWKGHKVTLTLNQNQSHASLKHACNAGTLEQALINRSYCPFKISLPRHTANSPAQVNSGKIKTM